MPTQEERDYLTNLAVDESLARSGLTPADMEQLRNLGVTVTRGGEENPPRAPLEPNTTLSPQEAQFDITRLTPYSPDAKVNQDLRFADRLRNEDPERAERLASQPTLNPVDAQLPPLVPAPTVPRMYNPKPGGLEPHVPYGSRLKTAFGQRMGDLAGDTTTSKLAADINDVKNYFGYGPGQGSEEAGRQQEALTKRMREERRKHGSEGWPKSGEDDPKYMTTEGIEAGEDVDGVTRETLLDQYKTWLGETAVREGGGTSLESLPDITNFENYSDYRGFLTAPNSGKFLRPGGAPGGSVSGRINKANAMRAFGKTLKGADKDAFDKFRAIDKEASGERKRMQRMLSEPNDAKRSKMAEAEKKKPLETKTQYVLSEQGIQRESFETALRQLGYTGGKTLGKKPTGSKQRKELLETQAEIAGHLRGERDAKLARIRTAKVDAIDADAREDAIAEQLRKTKTDRMDIEMKGYAARLGLEGKVIESIMKDKATDPATAKRLAKQAANIIGWRAMDQARDKAMKTLESLASQDPAAAAKLKAFRFQVAYLMGVKGLKTEEWSEPLDDILEGLVPGYRAAHRR